MGPVARMGERGLPPLRRGSFVKIDGLREPEHAVAAIGAGADAIGFIFAPARRQVSSETAAVCLAAARAAHPEREFLAVGVFVDALASEIARVVNECGLDVVQLHGDESADLLGELPVPAIKVFRPLPGAAPHAVLADMDRFLRGPRPPAVFLIDGYAAGSAGGSGTRADWGLAADIASERPVILGGGLDPENVGEAIRRVRPFGVDVSSGVEVGGVKDTARIEAFIWAAHSAFREAEVAPS